MKLTEKKLKQMIEEAMNQPCEDIDPNIKSLILSGEKEQIIQGFELYSMVTDLDIDLDVHGGTPNGEIPDPRVHISVEGPDWQKFMECFRIDKLISERSRLLFIKVEKMKMAFVPTGMRYNVFKKHFAGSE